VLDGGSSLTTLAEISQLLAQAPDERLANLERYARCITVRFRRRKPTKDELELQKLMPDCLAKRPDVYEYTSCAICLTDFADGEELRRAPCAGGHAFHPRCLQRWLDRSHATCPVCRGGEEADGRGGVDRSRSGPSAEAMAEYVIRRMRSGKVDLTVSPDNWKRCDRVMKRMRDPVPVLHEEPVEEEEAPALADAPLEPEPPLPLIFAAKLMARERQRAPGVSALALP